MSEASSVRKDGRGFVVSGERSGMQIQLRGVTCLTLLILIGRFGVTGSLYSQPVSFPLHIGDRWEYGKTGSCSLDRARILRDTLMPNGVRYTILDSIPDYTWPLDFTYVRHAGDTVWHYNSATQSEELLYRFDASPGDTLLKVPVPNGVFAIVFHFQSTVTLFGTPRRQWIFGIYPMHYVDGGQSRTITDSLGLTNVVEHSGGSILKGALLNGRGYGTMTSVAAETATPRRTMLHQNFPNPFNPSTTIRYTLPNRAHVSLSVFNTLGQLVAQLVEGEMDAGYHEVKFGARGLSSGVYLYRLQADRNAETMKAVLVR
jgi:hypothetical protein